MKIIHRVLPLDDTLKSNRIATKYLQETSDGFVVEATYIRRPEKHTLCVSTQVGCAIGCKFCISSLRSEGKLYQRSLTNTEIIEECCNITQEINFTAHPKPLTFAFMGEGEPFLNFDECVKAFHILTSMKWPVPIQLSVSTSGIRPDLIRRLGEIIFPVHLKLHVSLHGPNDEIHSRIMPNTKPISEIVVATQFYQKKCGRLVIWNYVLCAGVNDQLKHAKQLVKLFSPGWRVKFTRLNLTLNSPFRPSPRKCVEQFRRILENNGIFTSYSETNESDIYSGCGQLSYHYTRH